MLNKRIKTRRTTPILSLLLLITAFSQINAEKYPPGNDKKNDPIRFILDPNDILIVDKYQDIQIESEGKTQTREEKNRIVLKVIGKEEDNSLLEGKFFTYSRSPRQTGEYRLESQFFSQFKIKSNGKYEVEEKYLMPNLRDLPTFPNFPVSHQNHWTSPALEIIQMGESRLKIPVKVFYKYTGIVPLKEIAYSFPTHSGYSGREFDRFEYNYTMNQNFNRRESPVQRINGFSSDEFWFDRSQGIPIFDSNRLAYNFKLFNGKEIQYKFKIYSWYKKIKKIGAEEITRIANNLSQELKNEQKINVSGNKEGILLSLDDILFELNSADLSPGTEANLKKISTLLQKFPDQEIRISGHTDNSGNSKFNEELSDKRARTVLKALKNIGIDDRRMSYRGYGETKPIATNETKEGRAKNRRVEILIVAD